MSKKLIRHGPHGIAMLDLRVEREPTALDEFLKTDPEFKAKFEQLRKTGKKAAKVFADVRRREAAARSRNSVVRLADD